MTRSTTAPGVGRAAPGEPQLASFRAVCEQLAGRELRGATALHEFSVSSSREFWQALLHWSGLLWEGTSEPVCTGDDVETARFFPGVRLNYAENVLCPLGDDDAPALTSVHATRPAEHLTRGELRSAVARTAAALRTAGVGPSDTVASVAPNHAGTVVAALAVAAIGATLSSATPDMGPGTLLGRFGQVRPAVLLVDRTGTGAGADGDGVAALVAGLPEVRQVLVLDDEPLAAVGGVPVARLAELVAAVPDGAAPEDWPRLPFDHPLWVMFSSGTTGPPKAMVHGAGGSLLEHVKEHRLHGDLRRGDVLYFHTTTAWMMWNWQLSALAVGAHVVLYDGPVDGPETLWRLVAEHGVTVFGTSPAYLQLCQDEGYRPRDAVDLRALRAVLSTGAVLHDWQFDWLADAVGDVPLQSVSGGTDIVGCFVLGHPELPVQRGRSQALSLGLDVAALDDAGVPVLGEVGELVCRRPFPSRPVGFLADPDGRRFHEAYFADHPGVWTHGDRIEIAADGSARVHGRSDGVLNIDGIRIGPSEIYTIVRRLPEVADAMALEQQDPTRPGAARLVLLVVLTPGTTLDDDLAQRVRAVLRRQGSAAHVPSLVLQVEDLPVTHNGKKSERAARDTLDGVPVRNLAALRNPASLAGIATAAQQAARADAARREAVDDIPDGVARAFAEVLHAPVDEGTHFFDAGGTSRQSMTLLRRLRGELGRPIGMDDFLADPTVRGLRAALAADPAPADAVERLREGAAGVPPLVFVHGVHGDTDLYRSLVQALETDAPVYGLTAHPGTGHAVGTLSLADLARRHVETLTALVPDGPVRLAGYSFGGLVAFEMAGLLTARGREVTFLGLLDTLPPSSQLSDGARRLYHLAGRLAHTLPGMGEVTAGQFRRRVADRLLRRRRAASPAPATAPDRELARGEELFHAHRWSRHPGPVSYFRARRRPPVVLNHLYAWRRVAPDLTVVDVPGAHDDLLAAEHTPELAARFSAALRRSAA
ncbi:acetoacetate--CoA ligase [Geodermatophilus telluris]|uniref:acetoacetate--CoA ligase n=1 Tax=Geodermatophilus telluris TaxID=1190417 RepID=UPI000B8191BC|nr:acetoacetate--CoA ligase [Geodermatophilus telluris]